MSSLARKEFKLVSLQVTRGFLQEYGHDGKAILDFAQGSGKRVFACAADESSTPFRIDLEDPALRELLGRHVLANPDWARRLRDLVSRFTPHWRARVTFEPVPEFAQAGADDVDSTLQSAGVMLARTSDREAAKDLMHLIQFVGDRLTPL